MVVAGETFCLTAALFWAVAVVLFRAPIAQHGARTVNLFKSLLATGLLAVTVPIVGSWSQLGLATGRDIWLIALSGLIGITIGDTALFAAVTRVGVHRTLLLQTTAPLFAAILAAPFGDQLSGQQILGGAVVLAGIALVIGGPSTTAKHLNGKQGLLPTGLLIAVLAAFCQGAGIVVAKLGLGAVPVLPATFVRLAAATAGLLVLAFFHRGLTPLVESIHCPASMKRLLPASFLGTYLSMLLAMAGIALAPAGVAAVLLATTPAFSLVIEAWIDRKRPAIAAICGTIIAITGVVILTTA